MTPEPQRVTPLESPSEESLFMRRNAGLGALCAASPRPADRVVIVRRLGGGVAFTADPGGWATRQTGSPEDNAVAADDPRAAGAEAVWFADRLAVWLMLAERAAAGQACDEWFWPLAAPGWHETLMWDDVLRLAAVRCFEQRGLAGTLQLAARLVHAGLGETLIDAMDSIVVLGWLVEIIPAASAPGMPDRRSRKRVRREMALVEPWRSFLGNLAASRDSRDPRFVWVLAAAVLDMATTPVLTPEFGLRVALGMRERVWEVEVESEGLATA